MRAQRPLTLLFVLAAVLVGPGLLRPAPAAAISCDPCPAFTTADLNLRAGPSLGDAVLRVIPVGAQMAYALSSETNGYVPVIYDGTNGWAYRAYLDPVAPNVRVTTDWLNLRAEPYVGATVLTVMPPGAPVTLLGGLTNGWAHVDHGGLIGWAFGDYLAIGPDDGGVGGEGFALGAGVVVNTEALNVRSAPGLQGAVVNVLPAGWLAFVADGPVVADGYTWYRLEYMGQSAWAAGEFLVLASAGGIGIGDGVVTTVALNLRTGPTLGAGIQTVLSAGVWLSVIGGPVYADGYAWYQVGFDGALSAGWVAGEFLAPA